MIGKRFREHLMKGDFDVKAYNQEEEEENIASLKKAESIEPDHLKYLENVDEKRGINDRLRYQ
jgi:hypothetical protein